MKIYILGCGGWIPGKNETSCILIEHKNELIMLDAGTGVSNLGGYKDILEKYDRLSIVLSHYHLDHVIGLIYLLPYINDKKLDIYGPGIAAYKKSTKEYLEELLQTTFFARPLEKFCKHVCCHDYTKEEFYIGDVNIKVSLQQHSAPSYRIEVDSDLVYATDTLFDEQSWKAYRERKLLLHECWEINTDSKEKHASLDNLLAGFHPAQFEKIVLIHQNPEWSEEDLNLISCRLRGTNMQLGNDGMLFEI